MNNVYNQVPIIYYIPAEEKDIFINEKKDNGYLVTGVQYIEEKKIYEIALIYLGIDMAD